MNRSIIQIGNKPMRTIPAVILFAALALGSVMLKDSDRIGELSFVSLLIVSVISGFVVFFRDRLKKANFKEGFELFEAVKDVKEAEDRIKVLARHVAELVDAANQGSWKSESYDDNRFNEALAKVRDI